MSNQLKAFVGHSFTDNDKIVVREFLDYFNQIKDLAIGFSWEHAEKAESKELTDKVLRLMEDKNLFIGICTSKEEVIIKKAFNGEETAYIPKTSDWIIQEIGFAVGREMDLILLLENGVREPGGLQGNLEYIPFDRGNPSKSFGKILEMINDLLPKAKAIPIDQTEIPASPVRESEGQENQTKNSFSHPNDNWDIKKYFFAFLRSIIDDNDEEEKVIKEAFSKSKFSQDHYIREKWEAMIEYARILADKGGNLANLETLARKYPDNSDVQKYLASAYKKYDDFDRAATQFETAAQKAKDKLDEMKLYGEAALSYAHNNQKYKSDIAIQKMKEIFPVVENGEVELIKVLCEISEIIDDQDLFYGLTEKLLQVSPADIESRFKLAYKYATLSKNALALFHYLKIPESLRGSAAWNNLGVAFDNCNLTYKAVKAYRQAEILENTLAMSNLANKFINDGFLDEAKDICNHALFLKDYHKNVVDSISRIKAIPDEEDKQEKQLLIEQKKLSEFYREYGYASLRSNILNHLGKWKGPLCVLELTIEGKQFMAIGKYKQQSLSGIAQAFSMNPYYKGIPAKEIWYEVKYEGEIFGQAAKCIYTVKETDKSTEPATLLGMLGNDGTNVLMVISDSLKEIEVYEKSSGDTPKFYNLSRID
ncbi:MAG: hypothetical protein ABFD66_12695 [Smithella sp.]